MDCLVRVATCFSSSTHCINLLTKTKLDENSDIFLICYKIVCSYFIREPFNTSIDQGMKNVDVAVDKNANVPYCYARNASQWHGIHNE